MEWSLYRARYLFGVLGRVGEQWTLSDDADAKTFPSPAGTSALLASDARNEPMMPTGLHLT